MPSNLINSVPTSPPQRAVRQSVIVKFGKKFRSFLNWVATGQSTIATDPVLDPTVFPWTRTLAEHWQDIAAEAADILHHRDAVPPLKDISPDHARIAGDGRWRSFFLIGYGHEVAENCARAPRTAALVRAIPDINSAFFSILDARATIPRHRGVTRGIVTCHLGLITPAHPELCRMKVADEEVSWRQGEWLAFDDSYFHQVSNDTDEQRVILLVQVRRPMRLLGRMINAIALGAIRKSPFVQDARRNLDKWEDAYRQAERNELG